MERLVEFMATPIGRWTRIGAGAFLILGGMASGKKRLIAFGAIPLVSALVDYVPLAAFIGLPPKGSTLRRELGMLREAPLFPPVLRPEQPMYASA
jgi:hypothetical protein